MSPSKRIGQALVRMAQSTQPYYLRFGKIPKEGTSGKGQSFWKDPKIPERELGISVYNTKWDSKRQRWKILPPNKLYDLEDLKLSNRPIYLLSGIEIGKGSDGEPLIDFSTLKVISQLSKEDIYHNKVGNFDFEWDDEELHSINPRDPKMVKSPENLDSIPLDLKKYMEKRKAPNKNVFEKL